MTRDYVLRTMLPMVGLFLMPLVAAVAMVGNPQWLPARYSNHGSLINPPLHTAFKGNWTLVVPQGDVCDARCRRLQWVASVTHHALPAASREQTAIADCGQRDQKACRAVARAVGDKGALVVVDPMGNAMLRYGPEVAPRELLEDVQHLLRVASYWRNDGNS